MDCEKNADEQEIYTPPSASKKSKKKKLYECQHLCKANKDKKGRRLPPHPPSIIEKYKRICDLDDPRHFESRLKRNVGKEIDHIRT